MKVYTYSQARQMFAKLLDEARKEGEITIKRHDGQMFILWRVKEKSSPLDIEGVDLNLSLDELTNAVRESWERVQ